MTNETISFNPTQIDSIPANWTGEDLLNWFRFEDKIAPPIKKLLPYDDPDSPLVWEGLECYEELMFIYINKDLWGFEDA